MARERVVVLPSVDLQNIYADFTTSEQDYVLCSPESEAGVVAGVTRSGARGAPTSAGVCNASPVRAALAPHPSPSSGISYASTLPCSASTQPPASDGGGTGGGGGGGGGGLPSSSARAGSAAAAGQGPSGQDARPTNRGHHKGSRSPRRRGRMQLDFDCAVTSSCVAVGMSGPQLGAGAAGSLLRPGPGPFVGSSQERQAPAPNAAAPITAAAQHDSNMVTSGAGSAGAGTAGGVEVDESASTAPPPLVSAPSPPPPPPPPPPLLFPSKVPAPRPCRPRFSFQLRRYFFGFFLTQPPTRAHPSQQLERT